MSASLSLPFQKQQGAAMIIALIFLVLLTLLGVTIAANNTLQEHMAGNTRQKDMAFQSAETALQTADAAINDTTNGLNIYIASYITADKAGTALPVAISGVRTGSQGGSNDADYWQNTNNFDWANGSCVDHVTNGSQDYRYMVDYMGKASCPPPNAASTCYYYRVTARGTQGNSTVILQAMYQFK